MKIILTSFILKVSLIFFFFFFPSPVGKHDGVYDGQRYFQR